MTLAYRTNSWSSSHDFLREMKSSRDLRSDHRVRKTFCEIIKMFTTLWSEFKSSNCKFASVRSEPTFEKNRCCPLSLISLLMLSTALSLSLSILLYIFSLSDTTFLTRVYKRPKLKKDKCKSNLLCQFSKHFLVSFEKVTIRPVNNSDQVSTCTLCL